MKWKDIVLILVVAWRNAVFHMSKIQIVKKILIKRRELSKSKHSLFIISEYSYISFLEETVCLCVIKIKSESSES
jgi:hypothetical protein